MAETGGMNWSKPIGPLPTGAWAAIVVGMIGLAYWNRKQAAATAAAPAPTDTSATPGVGVGGWIATPTPLNDPSTVSNSPTTNGDWAQQAITWLIGQGYDPVISDAAIRNYINGQSLNTQQQAIVSVALKHFGAPPEAMSPPNTNPSPISDPTPPPPVSHSAPPPVSHPSPPPPAPSPQHPHLRYITVTPWPGTPYDSLAKIARHFYGSDNQWPRIYNANKAGYRRPDGSIGWITNPSTIYPGRTLWVP